MNFAPVRNLLLLIICVSFTTMSRAQDTVSKRNGEKIAAKVLEVNTTDIKFKRADSPDGPIYSLSLWELEYILYAGGRKESYTQAVPPPPTTVYLPAPEDLSMSYQGKRYYYKERRKGEADMLDIAKKIKDPKVDLMIKKVQDKKFIQYGTFVGGAILFNVGFFEFITHQPPRSRRGTPSSNAATTNARQNGQYMMLGAAGFAAVTVTFKLDRTRHAHMVVDLYNKAIKK
jgi:hypothetical protein